MSKYVIAVARDQRSTAPADWKLQIQGVQGITVQQETPTLLIIDASQPGINEVRQLLGGWCRIEPFIMHELIR